MTQKHIQRHIHIHMCKCSCVFLCFSFLTYLIGIILFTSLYFFFNLLLNIENHSTYIFTSFRHQYLQPTPVFLPGKFHGQRTLVGYSPWGRKELDMTDWLNMHTHLHLWIDWWMDLETWEILVPWPGIEPRPLAVKTQTPNHWTTREFHGFVSFLFHQLSTGKNWLFRGFCHYKVKLKVLVTQLCLSHCNPMDYSPPGFSVHGFLQAGILEWDAIHFSMRSS